MTVKNVAEEQKAALPYGVYSCAQTRELDQLVAADEGIASIALMKRAAKAAFSQIEQRYAANMPIVVICGAGNNGGDGYIIAALAAQKNRSVDVLHVADPAKLNGDAQLAYQYAVQEGVEIQAFSNESFEELAEGALIVDAMLGTGFSPPLRDNYAQAIQAINSLGSDVFAIDIPSGLEGDTGNADLAVRAQVTLSFISIKPGLLTGRGPALCGELLFADLGAKSSNLEKISPSILRVDLGLLANLKIKREADAHKGQNGFVLVCGGNKCMGGAGLLAAESALRSGAGLVGLSTHPDHISAALARVPEVMSREFLSVSDLEGVSSSGALQNVNALVVGPGLGRDAWSEQLLLAAMRVPVAKVVDADALNLIAEFGLNYFHDTENSQCIFTPHPGEAARLLKTDVSTVQKDRLHSAKTLQSQLGGVVLLKGAGTIIAWEDGIAIANTGSSAMAVGGMGDVLSGVIGALLAQGLAPLEAAQLAVCAHGEAGIIAAKKHGVIGLAASDLLPFIRQLLN